jgi:hypothetical protein
LGRTKLWKPVTACFLRPVYEWRTTDLAIRHGRHILAEHAALRDTKHYVRGDICVQVQTLHGRQIVKPKKDLIALSVYGPRPKSKLCKVCGNEIRYVCAQLDGKVTPWMLDRPAALYHHALCWDRLIEEFPIHSEWDPIGRRRRNGKSTCHSVSCDVELEERKIC